MLYDGLTKLYPVSKTLRFELIPQGKTYEYIQERGFIASDIQKEEDYQKIKPLLDEVYKKFIDVVLASISLPVKDLQFIEAGERNKKEVKDKIQSLRKEITNGFKEYKGEFYNLAKEKKSKKDLSEDASDTSEEQTKSVLKLLTQGGVVKNILPNFLEDEDLLTTENEKLLKVFDKFTTYFGGFCENRANIFTDKAGSVAYRLIDENLPRFLENVEIFKRNSEMLSAILTNEEKTIFDIAYFNETLRQSGIDTYNTFLGGISEESGIKKKGINEKINLYNQQHNTDSSFKKIPQLKPLYKQILSDRITSSFVFKPIETDEALLSAVNEIAARIREEVFNRTDNIFFQVNNMCLAEDIFISQKAVTEISKECFKDWSRIQDAIGYFDTCKEPNAKKAKQSKKKSETEFSIQKISEAISCMEGTGEELLLSSLKNRIAEFVASAKEVANKPIEAIANKSIQQDEELVVKIHVLLDAFNRLQQVVKWFACEDKNKEQNADFYDAYNRDFEVLREIIPVYNKARNYITKKPYSQDKIKINFDSPTLLTGWDKNKEKDYLSVILKKNDLYYLAILDKNNKKTFDNYNAKEYSGQIDYYEKMTYKLLPSPQKMLPKVCFAVANRENLNPPPELTGKDGKVKKDDKSTAFTHTLIDFYKICLTKKYEEWLCYKFKFKETNEYNDMDSFFADVSANGYKLEFSPIAAKYIDNLVNDGKIYLFQIYNKDFSEASKGKPNLHTIYWRSIFDEANFTNSVVYQLNGHGELFWRRASLPEKITHPKNCPINNKNNQNPKKQSVFEYDLIKDKRYTKDKFFFHVPITINYVNKNTPNINEKVNENIKNNINDIKIIGIDRGERHLLYISLIDGSGKIIEQYSLNEITNNVSYTVDYRDLLNQKESQC